MNSLESAHHVKGETERLLRIMRMLRDPEAGCPWDREQDFASIAPYTIEEAYEVADAIERNDQQDLKNELGDLLFQVVFHAQMADELAWFDFDSVVDGICEKLERRHPHVFGDQTIETAAEQTLKWEEHKQAERYAKDEGVSLMDDMPRVFPALVRACKLQKRAAQVGFDWADVKGVLDKIQEELDEVRMALAQSVNHEKVAGEVGDLMFSCVNLARHLHIDPEQTVHAANQKFEQRFRFMEATLAQHQRSLKDADADELDQLWNRAKAEE